MLVIKRKNRESYSTMRKRASIAWLGSNRYYLISYVLACASLSIMYGASKNTATNLITGCVTMLIVPFVGYLTHMLSHQIMYEQIVYNNVDFERLPACIRIVLYLLVLIFDFHHNIHHDQKESSKTIYIVIEAIQNVFFQAGIVMLVNMYIFNNVLNNSIVMLWGMVYVSMHLINFTFYDERNHKIHHEDSNVNYEPFIFDIIFGTIPKKEIRIESFWHVSFNIVLCTLAIIAYKFYVSK